MSGHTLKIPHLFAFGLGYSARILAQSLHAQGWNITGTSRDSEKISRYTRHGYRMLSLDAACQYIHEATHILLSIPPGESGDSVLPYCSQPLPNLQWIGYLSTTGVYGDHAGRWVNEASSIAPPNARSKRRQQAEEQWLSLCASRQLPVHIFRLSGIYGPERNSILSARQGTARRIITQQTFSRIHVEDIAQTLEHSINHPTPGEYFNLADDLPARQSDVVTYACQLVNIPPPPFIPPDDPSLSSMARSFYGHHRRISNRKIKELLGVTLRHATYIDGLNAAKLMISNP